MENERECKTCGESIENIVELLMHSCDEILSVSNLTEGEQSTLLYIESRLVDGDWTLDPERMNHEDRSNIKVFHAAELLWMEHFEVQKAPRERHHLVVAFTDEAWSLAAECRRARAERNRPED